MRLRKLLSGITHNIICGVGDIEITSIAYDSRKVEPGALFICLKGWQTDGHSYVKDAIKAGAVAVILEQLVEIEVENKTVVQVENTREALAYISAEWFGHPAKKLHMIGITGTKGKTTTAHMIKKILEEAGNKVGMIGTMGACIGEEKFSTQNTTPESYELHRLFALMVEAGCQYVVMEVSSQALKQKRTLGIRFEYGAFLNISPDHIGEGEHKNFGEYLTCKKLLFCQTKNVIANIDDIHWKEITEVASNVTKISCRQYADFEGSKIQNIWRSGFLGVEFQLSGELTGKVSLNMPGQFNVENALMAIAITYKCGIEKEVIISALKKVFVKGRTQVLQETAHFSTFVIDYAHNALSMENLLCTLKAYHPKRLICMFGGGGNKPKQRRYDMGMIAGKYADLTIITMDNPRYESMEEINRDIVEGLMVYQGAYEIIPDREQAIHYLIDNSGREDIVVLVGKGHEEYQEVRGKKYYFSEENIVNDYLLTK